LKLWAFFRQHRFGDFLYRLRCETAKRLGITRHLRFPAREITREEFCQSISIEGLEKCANQEEVGAILLKHFRNRKSSVFFFDGSSLSAYKDFLGEDEKKALLLEADKILSNTFNFLGSGDIHFEGVVPDWHSNLQGGRWPSGKHWTAIDIRSDKRAGDVKLCWELNRHQYFMVLGRAWKLTGDNHYAECFIRHLNSWIEKNPPETGVNWVSNLEIALRLISWTFALAFFKDYQGFTPELFYRFIKSIMEQSRHLEQDFEFSRRLMPNNHLIGDAVGLFALALNFPEFKGTDKRLLYAEEILNKEALKQFYTDGGNWELSTSYQSFVLGLYLYYLLLSKLNKRSVPDEVKERLQSGFKFIKALSNKKGRVFVLGDSDDSRVFHLSERALNDFRGLLAVASFLFDDNSLCPELDSIPEEVFWLFGSRSLEEKAFRKNRINGIQCFENTGLYLFNIETNKKSRGELLFRAGPLGISVGVQAGHGHAGQLSIQVRLNGEVLIRDAGTFTYNGERCWRDYFRSSFAHNVLLINGREQVKPMGLFRWESLLNAQVFSQSEDSVKACYTLSPFKVFREIKLLPDKIGWEILDTVEGMGEQKINLYFQAEADCLTEEQSRWRFKGNGADLLLEAPETMKGFAKKGEAEPKSGWTSDAYGEKKPAEQLILEGRFHLPVLLRTKISILSSEIEV